VAKAPAISSGVRASTGKNFHSQAPSRFLRPLQNDAVRGIGGIDQEGFEIMKVVSILSATDPESHGRGSLPFILTTKPSYSAFTFENLLIANAIRRETFILLSVIRLT
jgi:hypothetical protein